MVEMDIEIVPLGKRFVVEIKDANKASRNRSYGNASDCCGRALKQEKRCSGCGAEVSECSRKIVKIGKEEYVVDAKVLKQAKDALESMEGITVSSFLKNLPAGAEDRFESLVYASPKDKKVGQYAELAALLKGRVAVGKGVFRSNEFQVLLTVGDDGVVRIRKLVEESQRYAFDSSTVRTQVDSVKLDEGIVAVEQRILDKATVEGVDLSSFKDTRSEVEERIIEDIVVNGRVPDAPLAKRQEQESQDELARLKALLGE
jgi:hypothetical protein